MKWNRYLIIIALTSAIIFCFSAPSRGAKKMQHDYYVVDTIYTTDYQICYRDSFFHISFDDPEKEFILYPYFFDNMLDADFWSYYEHFGDISFFADYPILAKGGPLINGKYYFSVKPTYILALSVKGKYFNKIHRDACVNTYSYNFKDPEAYYIVMVPYWWTMRPQE